MNRAPLALVCAFALIQCGRTELRTPTALHAPRPIAPLSTSRVTSQRPLLHWELRPGSDSARVELCRDPDCTTVTRTIDVEGNRVRLADQLEPGVWFWRVRAVMEDRVSAPSSPPWEFFVGLRDANVTAVGGTWMDFDRDGRVDFVLTRGNPDMSAIDVHLGRDGAPFTRVAAMLFMPGFRPNFGIGSHAAADVNGDGYGDLLVRDWYDTVRPHVYLGGPDGLNPLRVWDVPLGDHPERVDGAVAVGDVDGDGYGDILIGSRWDATGTTTPAIRLVRGGATSWQTTLERDHFSEYGFVLPRQIIGDVNADGFADLVFAQDSGGHGVDGCVQTNGYVFLGEAGGFSAEPSMTLTDTNGNTFGDPAFFGGSDDINGDGWPDLIVRTCAAGIPPSVGGDALFAGGTAGLPVEPTQRLFLGPQGAPFARSVGDFNGDGFGDVVLTLREGEDTFQALFPGGAGGIATTLSARLGTGFFSGGVGDLDGDGIDDILIGLASGSNRQVRVCFGSIRTNVTCGDPIDGALP